MGREEEWINAVDLEFDDAEANKFKYIQDRSVRIKKEVEEQQVVKAENGKRQLLTIRKIEEASFTNLYKNIKLHIELQMEAAQPIITIVKEELLDLKQQLEACKQAHQNYIGTLDEVPQVEIQWIAALQDKLSRINTEITELFKKKEQKMKPASSIRLEPVKMPKFNGDIGEYPRFKADFTRQVVPEFKSDTHAAAYVLKSCLSKLPLDIIRNVDDDIQEMWSRLDEKYGKASKLTDAVMNDIKKMRPVREGDNKRLLELVDTVESGFRDLERLKFEREMSNSTVVSLIEDKLPRDIRKSWALEVSKVDSKVKDDDKFPSLLEFLLEQKRAIEYDTHDLRTYGSVYGSAHHLEGNDSNKYPTCVMHLEASHNTRDCRDFCSLLPSKKVETIQKNQMCYCCLEVGHKSIDCKNRRRCNIDGCIKNHHNSLHQGMIEGVNYHAMGNARNSRGNCLLQIMSIKPVHRSVRSLTVFSDGGATISLITFKKAALLRLNGTEVVVTVTKVGGKRERMTSCQYSLPLLDKKGNVVEFQVYGIDQISEEVKIVEFEDVIHLFTNLRESEVKRPVGEVDVLIGFEYAGFHPVREQSADHLLLMSNRFGKCIGGSHKMLYEGTRKVVQHVVIHHCQRVNVEQFYKIEGMGVERSTKCSRHDYDNTLDIIRLNHVKGVTVEDFYDNTLDIIRLNHVKGVTVEDFYSMEAMGVDSNPKCGSCKCGRCPIGGKNYTLKEERELRLIEGGLQHVGDHWIAKYPWRRNPSDLPDNRSFAVTMLKSLERRLLKNPDHAKVYQLQIEDMISRDVARKLTRRQAEEYNGPIYYISHHEVVKPGNVSTPCRIVFNSSAKFSNHILNDYWVKGPDLINSLLGILIRFREGKVAITGDIKKMYHSVRIAELDQHTHRFLWRNMKLDREPDTYVMTAVCFGDKPAGNIAITALRKTAEMGSDAYPEAAEVILRNTYVDDIVDSFDDEEKADKIKREIEELIKIGGFRVKQWSSSSNVFLSQGGPKAEEGKNIDNMHNRHLKKKSETAQEEAQKILGLRWNPEEDVFTFDIHLNFSPKVRNLRTGPDVDRDFLQSNDSIVLTKRMILSQINSIYDPLGLVSPFTVRAKILMRKLWSGGCKTLGWDDPVPQDNVKEWIKFFRDLFEINYISFKRCLKPSNSVGNPSLIIFSDGSDDAYGACAFIRWEKFDGSFESRLIASKNRITPLHRMTIVRSELCGAVLAKRLRAFIETETRFKFTKEYFIVDSQIVRGMIQRESYGFNTFVAVRIGEIQESTNLKDWYWVEGKHNVADWLTRGKTPKELNENSVWQKGAELLSLPESEWPLHKQCSEELPEQIKTMMSLTAKVKDTLASRIDINRFSKYHKVVRTTARILAMYDTHPKPSFRNVAREVTAQDFQNAEIFWYQDAQKIIREKIKNGELKTLHPKVREDGVVVVGGRAEKWMRINYDNDTLILLPHNHRLSQLYAEHIHREEGHLGVLATTSKIRSRVWITNLIKMVRSIKRRCVTCKRRDKEFEQQIMAPLPVDRLKPSPAWYATSLDFFGPMEVKGEVNKRTRGKAYGVLFNCLSSRAAHIDIAPDYTTDGFLMVLRRFISLRGYPAKLFSDPGSQLVSASKELKDVIQDLIRIS